MPGMLATASDGVSPIPLVGHLKDGVLLHAPDNSALSGWKSKGSFNVTESEIHLSPRAKNPRTENAWKIVE